MSDIEKVKKRREATGAGFKEIAIWPLKNLVET